MIRAWTDFEGALPEERIERLEDDAFRLHAYSETERESFRLDCGWENTRSTPVPIHLEVRWPTRDFSELRDCFYWRGDQEQDWTACLGTTAPGQSFLTITVPPGRGMLSLHPYYACGDLERFLGSLPASDLRVSVFGRSEHGRPLHQLAVGPEGAPVFLVTARNHANETSGNYCMEGMVRWLLSEAPLACYCRRHCRVVLVPMTNPDGVAEGMARYSRPRGADLHRTADWNRRHVDGFAGDAALEDCFSLYRQLRPAFFLNLHSYLFKFKDQIFAADEAMIRHFTTFMPDQVHVGKTWYKTVSPQSDHPTGWCAGQFGTVPLILEIPWFMRTAASMRQTGAAILQAALLTRTLDADVVWGRL